MKIQFTKLDTSYAGSELAVALYYRIDAIHQIANEFRKRDDKRTLVIVTMCPCCCSDKNIDQSNVVLVSPFCGIDRKGYKIETSDKYPPYRNPGEGNEAADEGEFENAFREAIERALAA
jgi:hypothetical protein